MDRSDALQQVFARLEPRHAAALLWFVSNEGLTGPRPLGHRVEGIPLAAYRGIHVPGALDYALSVYQSHGGPYDDLPPVQQDDGTWLYLYKAHRGSDGKGLESPWNTGLYRCRLDRVPVGVFRPVHASGKLTYEVLGLAFVEQYLPESETFVLHGPLRAGQDSTLWDGVEPATPSSEPIPSWLGAEDFRPYETADQRTRVIAEIVRRERQGEFRQLLLSAYSGRCAVSEYNAADALEAADIVPYRGTASHSLRNGLLLRADLHRLFDIHQLTVVADSSTVHLAPSLRATRYAQLEGRHLCLPPQEHARPSVEALRLHNAVFSQLWD